MRLPTQLRRGAADRTTGFWRDQGGATAVEYGLLVAGIAVAVLGALGLVGTNISATMTRISNTLSKT